MTLFIHNNIISNAPSPNRGYSLVSFVVFLQKYPSAENRELCGKILQFLNPTQKKGTQNWKQYRIHY